MMIEAAEMNLSELVEQIALKNEAIAFVENEDLYSSDLSFIGRK